VLESRVIPSPFVLFRLRELAVFFGPFADARRELRSGSNRTFASNSNDKVSVFLFLFSKLLVVSPPSLVPSNPSRIPPSFTTPSFSHPLLTAEENGLNPSQLASNVSRCRLFRSPGDQNVFKTLHSRLTNSHSNFLPPACRLIGVELTLAMSYLILHVVFYATCQ